MIKKIIVSVCIALLMFASQAQAAPEQFRDGVVTLRNQADNVLVGGGFLVKGGYVITNKHVIGIYPNIKAVDSKGNVYSLKRMTTDIDSDLALLRTTALPDNYSYLDLAKDSHSSEYQVIASSRSYADVYKTGVKVESKATALYYTSNFGSKSGQLITAGVMDFYSFSAEPGNSGSAVVNDAGDVVGVVAGFEMGTNHAMGVPLQDLKDFLDLNNITY